MKRPICLLLMLLWMSVPVIAQQSKAHTSFKPGEIWTDTDGKHINAHGGGMLFHKGKYYWFGEHKVEGRDGNKAMVGVSVYSSKDLYNWKNEGIALPVAAEGSGSEIEKGLLLNVRRSSTTRKPKNL